MKCDSCGADNDARAVECGYCGSHMAVPASSTLPVEAIFERIRSSDAYRHRNSPQRLGRLPKIRTMEKALVLGIAALFVTVSGFGVIMFLSMSSIAAVFGWRHGGIGRAFGIMPLVASVVPLLVMGVGVYILVHNFKRFLNWENSPVEAIPVIVADKRLEVFGGGSNSSARTSYFATLQTEDGRRQEYRLWNGTLYGRMSVGDAGILFCRGHFGLDFDRIDVASAR